VNSNVTAADPGLPTADFKPSTYDASSTLSVPLG